MPQHKVLCKYHLHGACFKGDSCQFSHSFNDPSSNVCTFYQRGCCSYGSRCRYDHVKLHRPQPFVAPPPPPSFDVSKRLANLTIDGSSTSAADQPPGIVMQQQQQPQQPQQPQQQQQQIQGIPLMNAWQRQADVPYSAAVSYGTTYGWDDYEGDEDYEQRVPVGIVEPKDVPICTFAASGYCPNGVHCKRVHGDLCSICNKYCLHPHRPSEREEHKKQCERNQKRLERLRMSQSIECSVCLERVLSKSSVAERKFGLLSGCDHPFCISCIRDWRGGSHPGMDLDTVVRACPVCRVGSHYVIPSVVWYASSEEKQEIVDGYKERLSGIDCKYFKFGDGSCPFGTSCFYRHAFSDGTKVEVKLRHLGAADGSTVIAKNIRLSDFIFNPRISSRAAAAALAVAPEDRAELQQQEEAT